jgi:hypothetical protein
MNSRVIWAPQAAHLFRASFLDEQDAAMMRGTLEAGKANAETQPAGDNRSTWWGREASSGCKIEVAPGWRHYMVASEFEYSHRFWMIVLVYVAAYAFYNLNHLNILYAVVPWNQGVHQKDMLVRFLDAAAALVAAAGAAVLTWSTAYRPPSLSQDRTAFSIAGPILAFVASELHLDI